MATQAKLIPETAFEPAPTPARPLLQIVETVPPHTPAPASAIDPDLPPALFRAMFGLIGLFLAIMFATFRADGMAIVGVICAVCLLGYFGVPWAMHRAAGEDPARPETTIEALLRNGVATGDGHRTEGYEAIGLALLLPIVLVLWGVAVAVIHASVM